MQTTSKTKKIIAAGALVLAGFGGGAAVAMSSSASAEDTVGATGASTDSGRSGETALTGDTLTRVTDAVLAEYPGSTIIRAETDNGGVYEAHITTAAGDELTVLVGEDFVITGTDTKGHGGRHGSAGGGGETALTGDTLTRVTDAVLAEYPGATIIRAETDNGGVYEAHINTAAGDELTLLVGEDFVITGTDTHR